MCSAVILISECLHDKVLLYIDETHAYVVRHKHVAAFGNPARKHELKLSGVSATQRKCNTFIPHVL